MSDILDDIQKLDARNSYSGQDVQFNPDEYEMRFIFSLIPKLFNGHIQEYVVSELSERLSYLCSASKSLTSFSQLYLYDSSSIYQNRNMGPFTTFDNLDSIGLSVLSNTRTVSIEMGITFRHELKPDSVVDFLFSLDKAVQSYFVSNYSSTISYNINVFMDGGNKLMWFPSNTPIGRMIEIASAYPERSVNTLYNEIYFKKIKNMCISALQRSIDDESMKDAFRRIRRKIYIDNPYTMKVS